MRYLWFAAFLSTVVGANWSLATWGIVPIGMGLAAPAGVYAAGLAFTCRDMLHETAGRAWVIGAILAGAALSWWIEPVFALASGAAFLASESADFLVYAPLRRRAWLRAVVASNIVGFTLDSALFLWLAFGSLDFLAGQLVGKAYMTALSVGVLWLWRNRHALPLRRRAA